MVDPYGKSPSNYHPLFSLKPSNSVNTTVISSISSIWEDEHVDILEDIQWKCLLFDVKVQGINAKKALYHVIGTKIIHIKICTASVDPYFLSIHKELKQIKAAKKGLLNDYSQKIISSVSRLQDNSSEVVD